MNIAIRVDASNEIGTGHVMRCLTIAGYLRKKGVNVLFVSRLQEGHMSDFIEECGFSVCRLPLLTGGGVSEQVSAHAAWLGVDWQQDAEETRGALDALSVQLTWLLVDHYALGLHWEQTLRSLAKHILVIDDLADRKHDCDLLLDQNLVKAAEDRYRNLLSSSCRQLIGPRYALVRSDFAAMRERSLERRKTVSLENLLVFMGGSDPDNETMKVVSGIKSAKKEWQQIDVIVGSGYAQIEQLKEYLINIPQANLHVQTPQMAELMTNADLAITAGGTVTWEKCTLGVPGFVSVLGENQFQIAMTLHAMKAQKVLGCGENLNADDYATHLDNLNIDDVISFSHRAAAICDGRGTRRVAKRMLEMREQ